MVDLTFELFPGKSFSNLMKDIYDTSRKKDRQINLLIGELKPLIKNVGDATLIVPLIKEYLEISVKNDEHLVKLAAVVQRLTSTNARVSTENGGNPWIMSEEEKKQLLNELDNIEDSDHMINEKMISMTTHINKTDFDEAEEL